MGCDYPDLGFECQVSWRLSRALVEPICALPQWFGLVPKCAETSQVCWVQPVVTCAGGSGVMLMVTVR